MTTYVALLRAVNVAGRNPVGMADLRDLCAGLGFRDVRTILQSGNLLFATADGPYPALEPLLEAETESRLGVRTSFLVRTADELARIVDRNPFPDEAARDPGHLVVEFLREAPDPAAVQRLQAAVTGPEVARVQGREAYVYYAMGIGRSALTHARIEKALGTIGTARNWNTVLRLGALVRP